MITARAMVADMEMLMGEGTTKRNQKTALRPFLVS